ncbi:MAG: pitrilysin family protein [Candidatus Omnitrophota bacterium]
MIKKQTLFSVLAFFILGAFISAPLNGQDITTLDNGLKAIVREDHRNPIVVFSVFMDIGAASEGEYSGTGISHLVEHMLFKGTKKYPMGSIEDILSKYGGSIQGYTSYDYTGYSITILKEHSDTALDILKEMLTEPLFDPEELKKEKAVIEREMDLNKDDPARRLSRMTFGTAFLEHPYRLPVIGYKENFQDLQREDLVKFFKNTYKPEKMTIAVVGDIDAKSILDKINQGLGNIPRGRGMAEARVKEPLQIMERTLEERADIEGAYLNISFHSTDILDKDLYAMDLLSFILGQGESSLLNENIRIRDKLVLLISAYNYTPRDPGLFVISGVLKEENVAKTADAVMAEIENIKQNSVKEEDLLKAKNNFTADYIYQKETIESQANDMAESQILTGSPWFFKKYIENIKTVSAEDLKKAALKYLNKENMTVTVLSKSGNSLKSVSESGMQKNEGEAKRILLANNVPLVVSENHQLPIIAVTILFKGGLRLENQDNNGVSMLVSQMLLDGTGPMSRKDIARFYESKAISLNTYSGNNSVGITVSCLKEQAEEAMKLASEICINPSFPEEELEREKNETLQAIDMQDNEIVSHGHRLLKEMLFKIHPYRFQATGSKESINKVTRSTLVDFYRNIVSADNIVIGVSGDCKTEEIKSLVEKYFSKIPIREKPLPIPRKEPGIEKKAEKIIEINKDQSLILLGFPGIDIYDKDRYAVEILDNILSSPSGVLFKSIREEKGLTYAVGAFNVLGLDSGYMVVYALTSRDNIEKARQRMFKEIGLIVKNGVKDEDMEKSKNYLKAMRKVSMQTNSSFIFSIAMDELYGLGYNDYKNFDKNIGGVTKEDVKAAAKRILTLDRCAVLILQGK